ncbi:hypothetical protein [Synechococcus sp. MIT S1220]|uniref:hypothetical protein n=1 Tax=Synechococcus sp. MIT S1220 TaxID=3082549 RepID=UPI0039B103F7
MSRQFVKQFVNQANPDSPRLSLSDVLCSLLTELGPVYVKLGQLLSTRADLISEIARQSLASNHEQGVKSANRPLLGAFYGAILRGGVLSCRSPSRQSESGWQWSDHPS